MKPQVNTPRGRARIHSKPRREERQRNAKARAEAHAARSLEEQLALAKSRRGNSAKEIARLEAQLAAATNE